MLIASPICGWLTGQSSSRRLFFVLGLLVLGGSTNLICIGSSIYLLALGFLLQGISSVLLWTAGPALLVDTVGPQRIGKTMGYCIFFLNIAVIFGAVLGRIVFERCGYYAVLAMVFGVILVDASLCLTLAEKTLEQWSNPTHTAKNTCKNGHDDTLGQITTTPLAKVYAWRPSLLLSLIDQDNILPSSRASFPPARTQIYPPALALLSSTRLLAVAFGILLSTTVLSGFDAVLPLFAHRTSGWSSTCAGLIFIPTAFPAFGALLMGFIVDRRGTKGLNIFGLVISLPFLVGLRFVTSEGVGRIVLLCTSLALLGASMSIVMRPLMAEITYTIRNKQMEAPGILGAYAQAYRVHFCAFAGGLVVGPLGPNFVVQSGGWDALMLSFGFLCALSTLSAICVTGALLHRKAEKQPDVERQEKLVMLRPPSHHSYVHAFNPSPPLESPPDVVSRLRPQDLGGKELNTRLDELYAQLIMQQQTFIGYPINHHFNYENLFRFLNVALNNVGDPFGTTNYSLNSHELERKAIAVFTRLTCRSHQKIWGYITSGGTEGNIYGLHIARETFPNGIAYYSEDAHYSVPKALRLLRMRGEKVRSLETGEIDCIDLRRRIKLHHSEPVIMAANIGTTMKGAIDSLPAIQEVLKDLSITDHYIHCDAALSGMILPFVEAAQPFGFDDGADSLSISGHKMIGSPLPCGVVLARREKVQRISSAFSDHVEYVDVLDTTLMGSRSGFAPIMLWYAMTSLEKDGFSMRRQVQDALQMAEFAVHKLNLVGVPAWRHKNSLTVVFPRPAPRIIRKWHLAPQGDIAHLITMPSVTQEQILAFVHDIAAEGSLPSLVENASERAGD